MLNFFGYDNTFTETSYHDDGIVAILDISEYMGNIYKYWSRIFPFLYKKFNS